MFNVLKTNCILHALLTFSNDFVREKKNVFKMHIRRQLLMFMTRKYLIFSIILAEYEILFSLGKHQQYFLVHVSNNNY